MLLNITHLNEDVLIIIAKELPIKDFGNLSQVCNSFNQLLTKPHLERHLLLSIISKRNIDIKDTDDRPLTKSRVIKALSKQIKIRRVRDFRQKAAHLVHPMACGATAVCCWMPIVVISLVALLSLQIFGMTQLVDLPRKEPHSDLGPYPHVLFDRRAYAVQTSKEKYSEMNRKREEFLNMTLWSIFSELLIDGLSNPPCSQPLLVGAAIFLLAAIIEGLTGCGEMLRHYVIESAGHMGAWTAKKIK